MRRPGRAGMGIRSRNAGLCPHGYPQQSDCAECGGIPLVATSHRNFDAANLARYARPSNGRTPGDMERLRARDAQLSAQGRCRCGLLLPCESCLSTIQELAVTRPGSGEAYPEAVEGLGISGAERGRDAKRPRGPAGRVSPGR